MNPVSGKGARVSRDWSVAPGGAGEGAGTITHRTPPRFTARWSTGDAALAEITGMCWTDEGAGSEDAIHIHDFRWTGAVPDQWAFQALMEEAAGVIDEWIARRL